MTTPPSYQGYPGHQSFPSTFPTRPTSFPAPRGMPPVRRAIRRLVIGVILGIVGIALVVGGIWVWSKLAAQHRVLVDNANDFAVEVDVAGEHFQLAAHHSRTVKVHDGLLEVAATGPNNFHESAKLDLPATSWGNGGRTAVYNVGGAGELAIISIAYGSVTNATPEQPLGKTVLQLLPVGSFGDIDEAFPTTVKSKRWGELVQRVCHITSDDHVGCPGI